MRLSPVLILLAGAALVNVASSDAPEPGSGPARAIDATIADPPDLGSAARPAGLVNALREAQNHRAVRNCLTSRGLSAASCRHRQPNQDVPLGRAQARNLESRYRLLWARPGPSSLFPTGRVRH